MKTYDIAVIPSDGIGREVTNEGLKVLRAAADVCGSKANVTIFDWRCDYYLQQGEMMSESAWIPSRTLTPSFWVAWGMPI